MNTYKTVAIQIIIFSITLHVEALFQHHLALWMPTTGDPHRYDGHCEQSGFSAFIMRSKLALHVATSLLRVRKEHL